MAESDCKSHRAAGRWSPSCTLLTYRCDSVWDLAAPKGTAKALPDG